MVCNTALSAKASFSIAASTFFIAVNSWLTTALAESSAV
jgi:hypothetical protein